jgi:cytochrome b
LSDRARPDAEPPPSPSGPAEVTVWDRPLRIFHWSLAICVLVAWLSANVFDTLHNVAGYCVLALLAFRLIWGFAGSPYARFSRAVPSPHTALRYTRALVHGTAQRHLGHNPAGGAMLVAMLLVLLIAAVTGHMQITLQFFGVAWVQDLHAYAADAVLALALLHVVGVVLTSVRHRENLARSMLTGRKERRAGDV